MYYNRRRNVLPVASNQIKGEYGRDKNEYRKNSE